MRRYLDDDLDVNVLISFLRQERHEVMSPRAVAMRGAEDAAHLSYATVQQCAVERHTGAHHPIAALTWL